jgi:hypothetical protein
MKQSAEQLFEARRQHTIRSVIAALERTFVDAPYLGVDRNPELPRHILHRLHKVIRAATATGGVSLELRTWISELQIACGNHGVSWVKDWPTKDRRLRHVQLLECSYEKPPIIYWTSPNCGFCEELG